jgi:hypothetical protein
MFESWADALWTAKLRKETENRERLRNIAKKLLVSFIYPPNIKKLEIVCPL